jgi:hypothetical protein
VRRHPLFVSAFVDRLVAGAFATPAAAAAELAAISDRPIAVSRARRAGQLAQLAVAPVFILLCFFIFLFVVRRSADQYPGLELMRDAAQELSRLESQPPSDANDARRRAVEVLIAGRYANHLSDPAFRAAFFPRAFVFEAHGSRLDRAIAAHPAVSPAELAAAEAELADFITRSERSSNRLQTPRGLMMVLPPLMAILWLVIAAPTVVFAPLFRGGLSLRLWGIGVVDRSGREVSAWRALGRALLAWAPLIAVALVAAGARRLFGPPDQSIVYFALSSSLLLLFLAGVVAALATPSRGLQDRLAGTWLVPR